MTGSPWWYSGDDEPAAQDGWPRESAATGAESEDPSSGSAGPRIGADWGVLLSGAQRVVDWATETVMAPHAEHGDPREHPQCLICRTLALIGESGPAEPRASTPHREAADPSSVPGIEWIPIREYPGAS